MKHILTCLTACIWLVAGLHYSATAQKKQEIKAINLKGLTHTKPWYIKKVMHSKDGGTYNIVTLNKDVKRLKTLNLFSNISFATRDSADGKVIDVTFVERKHYIKPLVSGGTFEGDYWIRLGAEERNLFGKGQVLGGYYQLFAGNSFKLYYTNRFIKGTNWGLSTVVQTTETEEGVYLDNGEVTYVVENQSLELTPSYSFNLNKKIEWHLGYFDEQFNLDTSDTDELPSSASLDTTELSKFLLEPIYTIDYVNTVDGLYDGYASTTTLQTYFAWKRSFSDNSFIANIEHISRYYKKIRAKGNFATRLSVEWGSNGVSPLDAFLMDDFVKVRYSPGRSERGTAELAMNNEFRQFVLKSKKVTLQLAGFTDIGIWRPAGKAVKEMFEPENIQSLFGGGVRVGVFGVVLRADYGVDVLNTGDAGTSFGLGQYF